MRRHITLTIVLLAGLLSGPWLYSMPKAGVESFFYDIRKVKGTVEKLELLGVDDSGQARKYEVERVGQMGESLTFRFPGGNFMHVNMRSVRAMEFLPATKTLRLYLER